MTADASSLYDELGGLPALRRLSAAFYERVLADDLLAPVFAGFEQRHVEHVAVWLAEIFGGPADFTARLGGHQSRRLGAAERRGAPPECRRGQSRSTLKAGTPPTHATSISTRRSPSADRNRTSSSLPLRRSFLSIS